MAEKILFPSSDIFTDADDLDCIHQCDLDLRTKSIPISEIDSLLNVVLKRIDTLVDMNLHIDLLSLLYDCFSMYPKELLPFYQSFKDKSYSSILNFNATIYISIALNRSGISIERDFVDDSLTYFKENLNNSNFSINGLSFNKKDALFSIHHILRVFPLSSETLSPFIPVLFIDDPTDFRLDLVAHIAASNLLALIPEKYYISLNAYINSPSSSRVFSDLIPFIPKESFLKIAPSLESYLISVGNPEMTLVFLRKCLETDFHDFKDFQSLFGFIDTKFLDDKLIEYLHKFVFTFSDKQTLSLTNFSDTEFYIMTLPEPQKYLSDEQIECFFASCNDPETIRRALKPLFTHPSLTKAENWARFINLIEPKDFTSLSKCFTNNAIDVGESAIRLMMHENLSNRICEFLRFSLTKSHRDMFVDSPHLHELLSSIHSQPSFSFWRLFSKSKSLIDFVVQNNFRCPFIMYGVATVTSFTKLDPNFMNIYIEPQTTESLQKVGEYVARTCINKTALFTSIDAGPESLSLMAAGHYYGTRIAYHQAKTRIEGLDAQNILYFTIVASMTYKVTNRLHASPVFLDIFTDPERYSMTIEGIKLASEEIKSIYFDHILTAMPTLYLFNTFQSKLRPIVLDMFKSKEYDQKQMVIFLMQLSHSTASPTVFLRRSLIKDQSYISVANNEPNKKTINEVKNEEHAFWKELGIDAIKLLSSHTYPNDFPLNFHCDCVEDKNIFNEMLRNEPTAELVRFLRDIAISTPKFDIEDPAPFYQILDEQIAEENWPNCESLIRFLCKIEKTDGLMTYFQKGLPSLVNLALTSVFKPSDTLTMRNNVTVDFVISLMASDVRLLDSKVRYFVERILNDDDTLLQSYIFSLKRIQRGFCVSTQTVASLHWDAIKRNPKIFGKAVNALYSSPQGVPTILIMRPQQLPVKPPSDFSLEVARKMMDSAFSANNSKILCWATFFIQSHGFLFENFDHIKYFEKMMGLLGDFGHSETDGSFRASLTTLALLYFYISIPKVADNFFEWFFAFRNKFNSSQIYAFLLIVRAFLSVDSVKTVMAAVLVRYDFLCFTPSQYNSTQYSIVTKLFLKALKFVVDNNFYTFDAIVACESPFVAAYEGAQSLQRLLMQSNPLNFISGQLDEDDQSFIMTIIRDRFFKRETENADSRVLEEILSEYPIDTNNFYPEWASKDAFDNLPQRNVATLLHHRVPQIPTELTPDMIRYLALRPNWVSLWIKSPSTLLLLPEHYRVIYETIGVLQRLVRSNSTDATDKDDVSGQKPLKLGGETRKDFPSPVFETSLIELDFVKPGNRMPKLPFVINPTVKENFIPSLFDSPPTELPAFKLTEREKIENDNIYLDLYTHSYAPEIMEDTFFSTKLFESLLTIASFGDATPEFEDLLRTIGKTALTSVLDHVCDILPGISNVRLIACARVLAGVSTCSSFTSSFETNLSKHFMATVCSSRFRLSTVLFKIVSKIFTNINAKLPERSIQVIKQMLLSGSCFTSALILFSKLLEEQKQSLSASIAISCDAALADSIEREVASSELSAYIHAVPELMRKRKQKLMLILKKLFDRYDSANIPLIIQIFDIIAPSKEELAFTTRHENADVPQEVKDRNPEFWSLIISNSNLISKIISSDRDLINRSLSFVKMFPALLEFPLRLSLFNLSCKQKLTNRAMRIKVHRDNIVAESFEKIQLTLKELFLGEINVSFIGEKGIDMGGIRRDWYTTLIRALFNPEIALFTKEREPNPMSGVNPEHLLYFNFTGKMIARAVLDNINIDCHLPTVLIKEILGVKVALRDLENLDPELFRSLQWMSNNDVTDLDMRFTYGADELGHHKEIPLVKNGDEKVVTNENKEEFIELMVRHRLVGQAKDQTAAFVKGFHALIGKEELNMFAPNELDLIICGIPSVDVRDMRQFCKYEYPFNAEHPVVQRFFAVIRHWGRDDLAKLLLFVTGSSQVPIGGFKTFRDDGIPFTLAPGGDFDRLPSAHTCTNTLDLPAYRSEKELNEKLHFSINECNTFGFN